MRRIISIWLGCLLLTGCIFFRAPDREKACNKIIPRATMAKLLADIYLLEGFLHEAEVRQPGIHDSVEYHYTWLFDGYNTTPWQFREALSCYLRDKEEMDLIHEQILSRLSLMESELDARAALEARRKEWQQKTESNRAQLGYPSLLLPLSWEIILQAQADTAAVRTDPPANDHQPDSVR